MPNAFEQERQKRITLAEDALREYLRKHPKADLYSWTTQNDIEKIRDSLFPWNTRKTARQYMKLAIARVQNGVQDS